MGTALGNSKRLLPAPPKATGMGRPTLYDPIHCALVVKMGQGGKSRAQIASILNVSRATLYEWGDVHPAFSDALARAREHEQAWWEAHAQKHLKAKHYQAQLWRYSMAGRFKDDYAEQDRSVNVSISLRDAISAAEQAKPIEAHVTLKPSKL